MPPRGPSAKSSQQSFGSGTIRAIVFGLPAFHTTSRCLPPSRSQTERSRPISNESGPQQPSPGAGKPTSSGPALATTISGALSRPKRCTPSLTTNDRAAAEASGVRPGAADGAPAGRRRARAAMSGTLFFAATPFVSTAAGSEVAVKRCPGAGKDIVLAAKSTLASHGPPLRRDRRRDRSPGGEGWRLDRRALPRRERGAVPRRGPGRSGHAVRRVARGRRAHDARRRPYLARLPPT